MKTEEILSTWTALNAFVRRAGEAECRALLDAEKRGRKRRMFLTRIHSRINRVRRARERAVLIGDAVPTARGKRSA